MSDPDVIIVGYGPTGMMLAALLGRAGHRVLVLERYTGLYNLPRAACFDHEIMRTFQKLGSPEAFAAGAVVQRDYEWVNGSGEVLLELTYDDPGVSGWAELYMMFQPDVEDALDRIVRSLETVEVRQGAMVDAVENEPDRVAVRATGRDGEVIHAAARYLVGCDGGNSFIRRALQVGIDSYSFEENWLVCDFRKRRPLPHVPTFRQVCDPRQPIAIVQIGPHHHRFSFMLEPDDTPESAADPERVWQRVSGYITPEECELIRVANYVFRSRIAERWHFGRALLAGDAAHEMPPFLAQGMCSGIRDTHNLAWKLDLILTDRAGPELLDTYQPEREPHVRAITEKAIELGRVQTMRDPDRARQRDAEFLARRAADQRPEKLVFPPLATGVIAARAPAAGELSVQGHVDDGHGRRLLDDVTGPGFHILARSAAAVAALPAESLAAFRALGGSIAVLADAPDGEGGLVDLDGVYARWLDGRGAVAALVRPDFYLYGMARTAGDLVTLLDGLIADLRPLAARR